MHPHVHHIYIDNQSQVVLPPSIYKSHSCEHFHVQPMRAAHQIGELDFIIHVGNAQPVRTRSHVIPTDGVSLESILTQLEWGIWNFKQKTLLTCEECRRLANLSHHCCCMM